MDIQIITRLNDESNQRSIMLSGKVFLSARVGTRTLAQQELACLFTSNRQANMSESIQSLEVWLGGRSIVACEGKFYAGRMPHLDMRQDFFFKFFLSIFMMCIEARDNLHIEMDDTDIFSPGDFFLQSLWR